MFLMSGRCKFNSLLLFFFYLCISRSNKSNVDKSPYNTFIKFSQHKWSNTNISYYTCNQERDDGVRKTKHFFLSSSVSMKFRDKHTTHCQRYRATFLPSQSNRVYVHHCFGFNLPSPLTYCSRSWKRIAHITTTIVRVVITSRKSTD